MALKIIKQQAGPRLKLPESIKSDNAPRPLWEVKIRSRLKPLHPFFTFTLEKLDIKSTIEFSISTPKDATVMGVFPGFWLDESMVSAEHPFDLGLQFQEFEKYFFRLLVKLMSDVSTPNYIQTRAESILFANDKIDLDQVKAYMRSLLRPYNIRARYQTKDVFVYNLVDLWGQFGELPVLHFNVEQMEQILAKQEDPNKYFKKYLLNSLVMALYHANLEYGNAETERT